MKALILSDTHGKHYDLSIPKKGFSIAIHTGDFSNGSEESTDNFLVWYSEIKCKHKILIAGEWLPSNVEIHFIMTEELSKKPEMVTWTEGFV